MCVAGEHVIVAGQRKICFLSHDLLLLTAFDMLEPCSQIFDATGRLLTYTPGGKLCTVKSLSMRVSSDPSIPSQSASIVIGTSSSQIFELTIPNLESSDAIAVEHGRLRMLMQGHCAGLFRRSGVMTDTDDELQGVAIHPRLHQYASCGDDRTVRVWDIDLRMCVALRSLSFGARCVAYAPGGGSLAVGGMDGSVCILSSSALAEMVKVQHRTNAIADLKFSPDGCSLAVASHASLDIYECEQHRSNWSLKRKGVCKGHSGSVRHVDWSVDGRAIRSTSSSEELLFWDANMSPPAIMLPSAARDVEWASVSCTLGWPVQGIASNASSDSSVLCCDATHSRSTIAVAGVGTIKLYRYPCLDESSRAKSSSHVHGEDATNLQWTCDDEHLISVGGSDLTVCQWRHVESSHAISINPRTESTDQIRFDDRVTACVTIQRRYRLHRVCLELSLLVNRKRSLYATLGLS